MVTQSLGPLLVIGGAEDKKDEQVILREFVRLAGGDAARLVIMTVATEHPHEVGEDYTRIFRALMQDVGPEQIQCVHIESREEAQNERALAAIEAATGVFFTGGDQFRITSLLGGTKVDTLLHARHELGLVLAGTSAGASMMSTTMIIEGSAHDTARVGMVRLGAGLEFLPGVLIDQHFAQRGRINRLLSAIAEYPHHLGVGIDEDTAMVVHGHEFEVIGTGSVTVIDAADVTDTNVHLLDRHEHLAICNVKLHILTPGYGFNLRDRIPRKTV
ncbi:MAG TPA: cyanophycinase [Oligoflexus sp.]|uniref:cyanophycinase n=1 Tax=Oligoflexus sp. TaxID=1971216 RepID=UPI002D4793E4|nr:cyanophycinase [Oligoflexus sp.]HYX34038.1 cyanophycinase [Oligoflexus sp.]